MDIFDQHRLPSGRRRAADPFVQGDLNAGGLALKRAQYQPALLHVVKTGPVDLLQRVKKQGGGVGQIGDKMGHAVDQCGEPPLKLKIIGHCVLLSDAEQLSAVFPGDPGRLFGADALHFCDLLRNVAQVSRVVALAPQGYRA